MKICVPAALLTLAMAATLQAETVKDREGAVRGDRARLEDDRRWNYNDPDTGFRLARETGKPLLVVLRCVPCLSCAGIDASVLEEKELAPLLDQFVCVRVINANALDLRRFQFDYDLSFSAMIFNGDGTVYGRFGSWRHQQDGADKGTAALAGTLQAALLLHQGYPGNKSALTGKQGAPVPYRTPVEFPDLAGDYGLKLDWNGKVVQSCVHCHMVGDAFRQHFRTRGEAVPPEWIYPQPSLKTLGADLAADDTARVEAVRAGSPAARAGLQAGDRLLSLNGQPLLSAADAAWALHRAPEQGTLPAVVRRGTADTELALELPAGWRRQSDLSKRVGTWQMRGMALGGMVLEEPDESALTGSGPEDSGGMALRVKHVGEYSPHDVAKKAGFKPGDILVQVDDLRERISESALIGHLLQNRRPGDRLKVRVLRAGERLTLELPQQ